tara:strand:+ start:1027 stop:1614 length:588 start_codon:yes stop_codon:yes gene_type:complete
MKILNLFKNYKNKFSVIFYFDDNENDTFLISNLIIIFRSFQLLNLNLLRKKKAHNNLKIKYNVIDEKIDFKNLPDDMNNNINSYTSNTTLYNNYNISYKYIFPNINPFTNPNTFQMIYSSNIYINNKYLIYNKINKNYEIENNIYELYIKRNNDYFQTDIYFIYEQKKNKNLYPLFNLIWIIFIYLSYIFISFLF